jgi:hypothetical protein
MGQRLIPGDIRLQAFVSPFQTPLRVKVKNIPVRAKRFEGKTDMSMKRRNPTT